MRLPNLGNHMAPHMRSHYDNYSYPVTRDHALYLYLGLRSRLLEEWVSSRGSLQMRNAL